MLIHLLPCSSLPEPRGKVVEGGEGAEGEQRRREWRDSPETSGPVWFPSPAAPAPPDPLNGFRRSHLVISEEGEVKKERVGGHVNGE